MPYEDLNPEEKKNLELINEEIDEQKLSAKLLIYIYRQLFTEIKLVFLFIYLYLYFFDIKIFLNYI